MDYDFDIDEFVNRCIAVWNEPDPDVRHNLIAALWDDEAVEFTDSATRNRFTMTFALCLTIEDGRITRHHVYEDSLAVAESFPTN